MNGLAGQNVTAVLNSGTTVGWQSHLWQITNYPFVFVLTRTCDDTARTQKQPVLRYSLRDGFSQSTISAELCRTPEDLAILQRNLVQRTVQVRIRTFCVLQEGRGTLLQGDQPNQTLRAAVFWGVMPCDQVEIHRRFGGYCRFYLQGSFPSPLSFSRSFPSSLLYPTLMYKTRSSETTVLVCQTTRRHIPKCAIYKR